jgi:hypothetical protein
MKFAGFKYGLTAALCLAITGGSVQVASSQDVVAPAPGLADSQAQAILDYWTPERMQSAQAMPIPAVSMDAATLKAASQVSPEAPGPRGMAYGWKPGQAPAVQKVRLFDDAASTELAAPQYFATAPSNPLSGPYGPFSRQTMAGTYLNWPASTLGKFFFSFGGSNFVCSATVIGTSTIATAGHCVSDGAGGWATNMLFCPGYYNGGTGGAGIPHPLRGCWAGATQVTTTNWHSSSDPDYDYACVVTATTGSVVANKIGNVVGTTGRAWNWGDVPVSTFGYPQAAPFVGTTIQQTNSTMWYGVDFTGGGQVSNVIGSDLTGGASGGGWFLAWRHPSYEIADTDGSGATDPGGAGPYITGVNSHKRCAGGSCASPPSASAGVFWQEMTSPPFLSTGAANDSEDVFAACFAHVNN